MKRILSILAAAVLLMTAFAGCSSNGNSSVPEKTTLIVGLDDSFPPMGFRDENNNIVGFDVDLAAEVADRLGLELKLQTIDWDSKEMELDNGTVDVLWNGLSITDARKESMLLSRAYLANSQVIVVKKDSAVAAKADLKDKEVGVQKGSSALDALNADEISKDVKEIVQMPDNVGILSDLKLGRIDAAVMDQVVADYYIAKEPDTYVILGEALAPEEYAVGFKKGNTELHDKVMAAFDEMVKDGTAAEISEKWFGEDKILKAE